MTGLSAIAIVCTLSRSPAASSSELLARHVLEELEHHGVSTSSLRVADHDVKRGVQVDMGDGDAWPAIRQRILAADILVLSTPIWMGHPCSIAQQVMERLDADLSETDAQGRPIMYGKVATIAVVGNEDGAHKTIADMMQGLNDIGFTISPRYCPAPVRRSVEMCRHIDVAEIGQHLLGHGTHFLVSR